MPAMRLLLRAVVALGSQWPLTCSAIWSSVPLLGRAVSCSGVITPVCHNSREKSVIKAIGFYDKQSLCLLKFYIMFTGIPIAILVTLANIYTGELAEIPEGYPEEHWVYHRHPITKSITYNLLDPPPNDYKKGLAWMLKLRKSS